MWWVLVNEKDETDDEEVLLVLQPESMSRKASMCRKLREGCKIYQKAFRDLKQRHRKLRVKKLSELILCAVMDRNKLRDVGLDYLKGNEEAAVDVITLLDDVKCYLEDRYFHFKFDGLNDRASPGYGDEEFAEFDGYLDSRDVGACVGASVGAPVECRTVVEHNETDLKIGARVFCLSSTMS